MFTTGITGGWVGGRLPLWAHGKQPALLIAAALAGLALWAGFAVAIGRARATEIQEGVPAHRLHGSRYLIPFAIWNLATGSFNPFFNVYFARLGYGAARIGSTFSAAQLAQVATVLVSADGVSQSGLGKWNCLDDGGDGGGSGLFGGSSGGSGRGGLRRIHGVSMDGANPLSTLLMNGVAERERGGASAMNYLVMFAANALAALAGGAVVIRFGYGVALAGSAGLAVLAAGLFRGLLGRDGRKEVVRPPGIT